MKHRIEFYIFNSVLLLILLSLPQRSFTQKKQPFNVSAITGNLVDSLTKKAIPAANISLFSDPFSDAHPIKRVASDQEGYFNILEVQNGTYAITVSSLEYNTIKIPHIKITNSKINLGTIHMSTANYQLEGVEIHGKTPLVQIKTDRLIYHTALDPTLSGRNAADALRKVPMLSVDIAGNVSLKGDKNVRILIDGKPSGAMSSSIADALKMIPADQIKNIEVMTSPSSKFDAEGGSGIINIITKRNNIQGIRGSYSGGFGTRQNNFNGNISVRKGKLGINGNLGNSWSWPVNTSITFEQKLLNNQPHMAQETKSRNKRNGLRGSISLDYDLDSNNLIISNFNFNRLAIQTDNVLNSIYHSSTATGSTSNNKVRLEGFDWNADYIRKFQKKKQELSFSIQLSKNNANTDYLSLYHQTGFRPHEVGENLGLNKEITMQMDYTHPFKIAVLEIGAKTIFRDIHSAVKVDTMGKDDAYLNVSKRTYNFDYRQDVRAIYSTIQIPFSPKIEFKGGIRYEYTSADSKSVDKHTVFHNQGHNVLPSAVVSYKISDKLNFRLSYNQRIQRPSLYFINPFRNESDPINQLEGNPELNSEFTHNTEIGTNLTMKKSNLTLSLYHRKTTNVIESIYSNMIHKNKPFVLQTFANIGNIQSFGTNIFASVDLFKILTLRGNIDLYTYSIQPKDLYGNLTHQANKIFVNYKTFISATVDLRNGWIAESFLFYDSPERTFQGHYASFNMWNIGVKKDVLKKKGTIGLTIVDPFNDVKHLGSYAKTNKYEQRGNFAIPFRSFGINFSWKFGKNNSNQDKHSSNIDNDDQKTGGEQQQ